MSIWFEGTNEINCGIQDVKDALENVGQHYRELVSLMPGMRSVELVDHGSDFVTIKTNEGLMKRTNITKHFEAERVIVELDEEYLAGRLVTTNAHFVDEFTTGGAGVEHHLVIRDLESTGVLGFLYKTFGKSNGGKAFLSAYEACLEGQRRSASPR